MGLSNMMGIVDAGRNAREGGALIAPADGGLASFLEAKVAAFRERTALSLYEDGAWRSYTYGEFGAAGLQAGRALASLGLVHDTRLAILSESRPEWAIAFFGAMLAGSTAVLLDPKLMPGELEAILDDCRPTALFASRKSMDLARVLKAAADAAGRPLSLYALDAPEDLEGAPSLLRLNAPPWAWKPPVWSARDTAVLVYTSGTSGKPKGVMTSMSNLLFQVRTLESQVDLRDDSVFLSILPLNHLLELTCGLLGVLHAGKSIVYCQSPFPADIVKCMREKRVTDMVAVPLFLKMLMENVYREARAKGKEASLRRAVGLASKLPRSWRRALFKPILAAFGGRLRGFVCGGAALDPEVDRFFDALGVVVYQGYGLTETSPVISCNSVAALRMGSVGRPLPGVEVKIRRPAGEAGVGLPEGVGEILTRGPHVMLGYFKRPDLTREAIDMDGWFGTGDLGYLDGDGFLHITGRSKNLIVLPGGKKVQPEEVEEALAALPGVAECCVFAGICADGPNRGHEEVVAVVVPTQAFRDAHPESAISQAMVQAVDDGLASLTAYKRPSRVHVAGDPLPKTPSRKVKRAETAKLFGGK